MVLIAIAVIVICVCLSASILFMLKRKNRGGKQVSKVIALADHNAMTDDDGKRQNAGSKLEQNLESGHALVTAPGEKDEDNTVIPLSGKQKDSTV